VVGCCLVVNSLDLINFSKFNILPGDIELLCKGAETAIFERVHSDDIETVEKHVNDFAVVSRQLSALVLKSYTIEHPILTRTHLFVCLFVGLSVC
jgi:hypothetical protein